MKKYIILLLLLSYGVPSLLSAQSTKKGSGDSSSRSPVSLEINSGLYSKVRFKVEYRFKNNNAMQVAFSRHYGVVNPGSQVYLEFRKYLKKKEHNETFVYGKAGYGKSFTYNGNYAIFGAGFGQKLNIGKKEAFYVQFSEGVKVCLALSGDIEGEAGSGFRGLFYIIGPGALVDINFNIGYRF